MTKSLELVRKEPGLIVSGYSAKDLIRGLCAQSTYEATAKTATDAALDHQNQIARNITLFCPTSNTRDKTSYLTAPTNEIMASVAQILLPTSTTRTPRTIS